MANFWAERQLHVTVATWSSKDIPDYYVLDNRVSRIYVDAPGRGKLRDNWVRVMKMRALIRKERPDAVLSFLPRSNVPTILAGIGLGQRIVVSERVQPAYEAGLPFGWRLLRRVSYGRATEIVSQTSATAAWIQRNWGHASLVIPNALRELPDGGGEREPLIVGIGRLARQKGFDLLLRAFARIAADFPAWRVVILGEGPERESLTSLRDELGLVDRAVLPGRDRNIEAWMSRAGLVVQPSRFEGFPNVVLESMGMGAAVISADCPAGPSDLIADGINGRLVPVEDVEALARTMAEMMARPDERARLGHAAAEVRQRFRQDAIMRRWEAVLFPQ